MISPLWTPSSGRSESHTWQFWLWDSKLTVGNFNSTFQLNMHSVSQTNESLYCRRQHVTMQRHLLGVYNLSNILTVAFLSQYFYMSKHSIPHMPRGSSIINMASINAFVGRPDLLDCAYSHAGYMRDGCWHSDPTFRHLHQGRHRLFHPRSQQSDLVWQVDQS